MPLRGLCQPVLHRPAAVGFTRPDPVGIGGADDRKILGQSHQLCTEVSDLCDQLPGGFQIVGDTRPGHHLDAGQQAVLFAQALCFQYHSSFCFAGATASSGTSTAGPGRMPLESTLGSAQLPVT